MQTTTEKPERKPLARTISLVATHGGTHLLEIKEAKSKTRTVADYYFATQIAADFGTAFRLEKQANVTDPEPCAPLATYFVNLHGLDGNHVCDCRGFGSHGHCRHVSGLLALIDAGKLLDLDALMRANQEDAHAGWMDDGAAEAEASAFHSQWD